MPGGWRAATGAAALACVLAVAVLGTACSNAGESRILAITGTGFVGGVAYLDVDGDREPGGPDEGLQNVRVRLIVTGTRDTVAVANSDANGAFALGNIPVGRYTVIVPGEAAFGDTISIVRIYTSTILLNPGDTAQIQVAVSYPSATLREARALPVGTKVFVEGAALNDPTTFGDSTVSVRDATGWLRVTSVRGPGFLPGDSVRFLGRIAVDDGEPVLAGGQATIVAPLSGAAPVPITVATDTAAAAGGGSLDAALVRVLNATVGTDTATVNGDYVFGVDDGSGPVTVVFDKHVVGLIRTGYVPGAVIDATGLLVPDGTGTWQLKPRFPSDVQIIP
jgi:hypothetical protein